MAAGGGCRLRVSPGAQVCYLQQEAQFHMQEAKMGGSLGRRDRRYGRLRFQKSGIEMHTFWGPENDGGGEGIGAWEGGDLGSNRGSTTSSCDDLRYLHW